jgi:mono/diheme cytochrome c family protein
LRIRGSRAQRAARSGIARAAATVLVLTVGALLPVRAAAGDPTLDVDHVLAEMGADPFSRYCASCHGDGGRGDGAVAATLRVAPADLTRIAARRDGQFPGGEIARFIDGRFSVSAHGTREMPIWGQRLGEAIPEAGLSEEITRGTIATLVEYLKSIQRLD